MLFTAVWIYTRR